jgi:hypothetical protein
LEFNFDFHEAFMHCVFVPLKLSYQQKQSRALDRAPDKITESYTAANHPVQNDGHVLFQDASQSHS